MKAWIEPNDDPTYMTTIDIVENNHIIQSTSYISRPLQWTIENLEPPDYTE